MRGISFFIFILGCFICACGPEGDKSFLESDPTAVPAIPSYSQHIKPMMNFYCGGCHTNEPAKEVEDCGDDLLAGVNVGTSLCVQQHFNSIMSSSFTSVTMPPGGTQKMTGQEKAILEAWQSGGYQP